MHRKKPARKALLLILVLLLCLLAGCAGKERKTVTSLDQLSEPGIRIGVPGTIIECDMLKRDYPEAEVIAYGDNPLGYQDVAAGRLDIYIYERREMELAIEHGAEGVHLVEGAYHVNDVAVGISPKSRIPDLREKLNAFIAEMRANGTLDDMFDRWVIRGEYDLPDIPRAENAQYHLKVATAGTAMPYTYYVGTQLNGYDIELAYRFASWLGADLQFKVIDFGGIVAAAATGDVDCIMSDLFVTEENSKTLPFSETLFTVEITGMVRNSGYAPAARPFWESVADSFEKTFVREDRWRLFLDGIGTTLLITVLSILFGTVLGFCVFLLCKKGNRAANGVTHAVIKLVTGLPTVVLLMVLYYVVFGNLSISATIVSVICFSLVFGSSVYGMVKGGVATVGGGQTEAACSLGLSDRRAFFHVVLPQALPHIMPQYREQIAVLIKATSVVGYVAVQDLTKMGDIVRSRTFEAFFPLLVVAAVYFLLAELLTFLARRVEIRIDPKKRPREKIMKGVTLHD